MTVQIQDKTYLYNKRASSFIINSKLEWRHRANTVQNMQPKSTLEVAVKGVVATFW